LGCLGEKKKGRKTRERILLRKPLEERKLSDSCAGNIGLVERPVISGASERSKKEKGP
jgi:hypothetical protein